MWLNECKWDIISLILKKLRPTEEVFKYFVVTISEKNSLKCLLLEYLLISLSNVMDCYSRAARLFGELMSFRRLLKLFGSQFCFCDICQTKPRFFIRSLQLKLVFCNWKQKHLKFRTLFKFTLYAHLLAFSFRNFSKNLGFRSKMLRNYCKWKLSPFCNFQKWWGFSFLGSQQKIISPLIFWFQYPFFWFPRSVLRYFYLFLQVI